MNNNYVILGIILVAVLMLLYKSMHKPKENFYYFYPPSNCMENVFGKTNCYPPFYFPFYSGGDYHYPYPFYY